MTYKITIPYLQIGEFRVETPHGFSDLLQSAWSKEPVNESVTKIASKYERTVFKNELGQIVTRYSLKGS